MCTTLDQLLFINIGKNKPDKVRKDVISNKMYDGGINVLDFTLFNQTTKVNWVKRYLKNLSLLNIIPHFIFQNIVGLHFLLQCPNAVGKLPVKLVKFHKQPVMCWSLLYKHNFSPHKCFIWKNSDIR